MKAKSVVFPRVSLAVAELFKSRIHGNTAKDHPKVADSVNLQIEAQPMAYKMRVSYDNVTEEFTFPTVDVT